MGHKVHPHGFRLGYNRNWDSTWFAKKKSDFADYIEEDNKIRKYIKKSLSQAAICKIEVFRASNKTRVNIWSARPGLIIGRKGAEIDRLRDELQAVTGKQMFIDIKEIKNSAAEPQLVAENIAFQIEKRIPFRRAMKKAVQAAMAQGAGGIKILARGRLGGAEIARSEKYKVGKVPLQTLRANIEYGFAEAHTTYGLIGIKVWIYRGEKLHLFDFEEIKRQGKDQQNQPKRRSDGLNEAKYKNV
ncbi:MAG: 30S ribosomal protein S3 [Candidatus Omnitrophica bacterium]|nr:30S ribosomal protein S3 [Candidatus Omnitrophota bacterium]